MPLAYQLKTSRVGGMPDNSGSHFRKGIPKRPSNIVFVDSNQAIEATFTALQRIFY
jgi:hypothetical protein